MLSNTILDLGARTKVVPKGWQQWYWRTKPRTRDATTVCETLGIAVFGPRCRFSSLR